MAGRPPQCDGSRHQKKIFLNDAELNDFFRDWLGDLQNQRPAL
jgi:hypothetical protein